MIVFFVYNILIFNYKDTKNYRDYQLFKRISYPELRFVILCARALSETRTFRCVVVSYHAGKFPSTAKHERDANKKSIYNFLIGKMIVPFWKNVSIPYSSLFFRI